jgi:hypothetical protein
VNLYGFVYNDPNDWFDDLGNEPRQQSDQKANDARRANKEGRNSNKTADIASRANRGAATYDEAASAPGNAASALASIVDNIREFEGTLDKATALATITKVAGALPEICSKQRSEHPSPAKVGCGCCIKKLYLRLERDGYASPGPLWGLFGGGSTIPPSGAPIGVTGADAVYSSKPCDEAYDREKYIYDPTTTYVSIVFTKF